MCRQILLKNPGSLAQCHRDPTNYRFVYCCVAFNVSIEGFVKGCKPILGLDGSFLKGKYGGCCLSILLLDGNNGCSHLHSLFARVKLKIHELTF